MLDIQIVKTTAPKAKPDPKGLGFGQVFTDHMFIMEYTPAEGGFHREAISPSETISQIPAGDLFH